MNMGPEMGAGIDMGPEMGAGMNMGPEMGAGTDMGPDIRVFAEIDVVSMLELDGCGCGSAATGVEGGGGKGGMYALLGFAPNLRCMSLPL